MKQKYQGTTRVKRAHLQALQKEIEILHMKTREYVNIHFAWTLAIANKMKANGEDKGDIVVLEKNLRSIIAKFNYVACSIEELQSNLFVHEQRISSRDDEEQALQVIHESQYEGRGQSYGSSRGRGDKFLTRPQWSVIIVIN